MFGEITPSEARFHTGEPLGLLTQFFYRPDVRRVAQPTKLILSKHKRYIPSQDVQSYNKVQSNKARER